MSLSLADVEKIARLARLKLSASEAEATLAQLNGIFALIETMQAVPTEGIEPLATPLAAVSEVALRLREDKVSETDHHVAYQSVAPATAEDLYLVPQVIE